MTAINVYNGSAELTFDAKAHAYFASIEGRPPIPVDGVTSIIKRAMGMSPAIGQWMANSAIDAIKKGFLDHYAETQELMEVTPFLSLCDGSKTAYKRISKEATDIGSAVHAYAEEYLRSLQSPNVEEPDIPADEKVANGCLAVQTWVNSSHVIPVFLERLVFSQEHWYAGTMDVLAHVDDELCVVDFKTSKPFRNAWKGPYTEMVLQLAAYALAIEEEFPSKKIATGWIVRLDKETGECDPHKVELTDEVKAAWLRTRAHEDAISKLEKKWKRN